VRFGGEVVRAAGRFAEDDEAIAQKKRDGQTETKLLRKGRGTCREREETKRILGVCLEKL
jgi:hypothetical protein